MDHADARNNRDAAQRSIWLHEENKRLAAENAELREKRAMLSISAVYWQKDGTAELTWEDIESGNRCDMTVPVTPKQGERLSEVVLPCVYYGAKIAAANATLNRLREVVPEVFTTENSHIWRKSLYKARAILYHAGDDQ